jgi:hypothetical protein
MEEIGSPLHGDSWSSVPFGYTQKMQGGGSLVVGREAGTSKPRQLVITWPGRRPEGVPRSVHRPRRKKTARLRRTAEKGLAMGGLGGRSLMVLAPFRVTGAFFPAVPLPEPGSKLQGGEGETARPGRDSVSCGGAGCRRRSSGQAMRRQRAPLAASRRSHRTERAGRLKTGPRPRNGSTLRWCRRAPRRSTRRWRAPPPCRRPWW